MTKVSILGKEPNGKKKIEFVGFLLGDCHGTSDEIRSIVMPSNCTEIILLINKSESHYGYDIMMAKDGDTSFIVFGHFNDGVV